MNKKNLIGSSFVCNYLQHSSGDTRTVSQLFLGSILCIPVLSPMDQTFQRIFPQRYLTCRFCCTPGQECTLPNSVKKSLYGIRGSTVPLAGPSLETGMQLKHCLDFSLGLSVQLDGLVVILKQGKMDILFSLRKKKCKS